MPSRGPDTASAGSSPSLRSTATRLASSRSEAPTRTSPGPPVGSTASTATPTASWGSSSIGTSTPGTPVGQPRTAAATSSASARSTLSADSSPATATVVSPARAAPSGPAGAKSGVGTPGRSSEPLAEGGAPSATSPSTCSTWSAYGRSPSGSVARRRSDWHRRSASPTVASSVHAVEAPPCGVPTVTRWVTAVRAAATCRATCPAVPCATSARPAPAGRSTAIRATRRSSRSLRSARAAAPVRPVLVDAGRVANQGPVASTPVRSRASPPGPVRSTVMPTPAFQSTRPVTSVRTKSVAASPGPPGSWVARSTRPGRSRWVASPTVWVVAPKVWALVRATSPSVPATWVRRAANRRAGSRPARARRSGRNRGATSDSRPASSSRSTSSASSSSTAALRYPGTRRGRSRSTGAPTRPMSATTARRPSAVSGARQGSSIVPAPVTSESTAAPRARSLSQPSTWSAQARPSGPVRSGSSQRPSAGNGSATRSASGSEGFPPTPLPAPGPRPRTGPAPAQPRIAASSPAASLVMAESVCTRRCSTASHGISPGNANDAVAGSQVGTGTAAVVPPISTVASRMSRVGSRPVSRSQRSPASTRVAVRASSSSSTRMSLPSRSAQVTEPSATGSGGVGPPPRASMRTEMASMPSRMLRPSPASISSSAGATARPRWRRVPSGPAVDHAVSPTSPSAASAKTRTVHGTASVPDPVVVSDPVVPRRRASSSASRSHWPAESTATWKRRSASSGSVNSSVTDTSCGQAAAVVPSGRRSPARTNMARTGRESPSAVTTESTRPETPAPTADVIASVLVRSSRAKGSPAMVTSTASTTSSTPGFDVVRSTAMPALRTCTSTVPTGATVVDARAAVPDGSPMVTRAERAEAGVAEGVVPRRIRARTAVRSARPGTGAPAGAATLTASEGTRVGMPSVRSMVSRRQA